MDYPSNYLSKSKSLGWLLLEPQTLLLGGVAQEVGGLLEDIVGWLVGVVRSLRSCRWGAVGVCGYPRRPASPLERSAYRARRSLGLRSRSRGRGRSRVGLRGPLLQDSAGASSSGSAIAPCGFCVASSWLTLLREKGTENVLLLLGNFGRVGATQPLELHVFADGVVEQSHWARKTILRLRRRSGTTSVTTLPRSHAVPAAWGYGAIAQLGERLDRTQEVGGSSPPSSTRLNACKSASFEVSLLACPVIVKSRYHDLCPFVYSEGARDVLTRSSSRRR